MAQDNPTANDVAQRPTPGRRPVASDLVVGLLALLLGLVVIIYAAGMPEIRPGIPGPGLFPTMIGGFLVLFGLAQAVFGFRGKRPADDATDDEDLAKDDAETATAETMGRTSGALARSPRWALINGLAFIAAIIFYIVAAKPLGFMLTMSIICIGLMLLLRVKPWLAVVVGLATTVGLWALFEKLLLVQLPNGILGF